MSLFSTIRDVIVEAVKRNRNIVRMGRTKIIRARIRTVKGKPVVQRRKKFSAVKGYTIRGGKVVRMSSAERIKRRISQRKAKIKRKAKKARSLVRRKRSMRRRTALGLKE